MIEQGLLTTDTVAATSQPVGAITSAAGLDNQIFAVGVAEGDVITTSQLVVRSLSNVSVPEGYDGVAVTVPYVNGGAGYVAPGDTVNLYGVLGTSDSAAGASTPDAGGETRLPRSEIVLTNVLVLDVSAQEGRSIDNAAQTPEGETTVGRQAQGAPLTYLLALRPSRRRARGAADQLRPALREPHRRGCAPGLRHPGQRRRLGRRTHLLRQRCSPGADGTFGRWKRDE